MKGIFEMISEQSDILPMTTIELVDYLKAMDKATYTSEYIENNNGWTNKENAGRYHLLRLDGKNGIGVIAAKDLYKDVTIKVTYGEKTVNATFNLAGFARELEDSYKKTGSEYYLVRAEAVKAVIYYSRMLDARY